MFIVQTMLVLDGKLAVTASFGFALAALSLVQWTADWGGLVLLARLAAQKTDFGPQWEASLGRLVIAVPITLIQLSLIWFYNGLDSLACGILIGGIPVAPVWAMNLSGYLDGHARNALSGPLAGLPWSAAALAAYCMLHTGEASYQAGLVIGMAYSAGCSACVIAQYFIARSIQPAGVSGKVTKEGILRFISGGAAYCMAEFPNQFYARALLVIVSESLGQEVLGVYIYLRQIISASAQAIGLIKRVEFPRFSRVVTERSFRLRDVLFSQGISLGFSFLAFLASLIWAVWDPMIIPKLSNVALYMPFFAAALPMWAIAATLGQVLIVQNRVKLYSAVMLCSIAVSATAVVALTGVMGLTFLALVDVVMFAAQAGAYYTAAFQRYPAK
ncbi:hypothetical protein [Microvirga sp. TS319]|uniref:hypothetical protein n=1 Tax=Microvirga sp. TS319 TaxID=3241165 RepID=UPI00351A4795